MPWMTANDISIHYELAGNGPSVVLMHEMGGTLDSWDTIAPALAERFRVPVSYTHLTLPTILRV